MTQEAKKPEAPRPADLSAEELERVAAGATSFARVVNNTVYGDASTSSDTRSTSG